MTAFEQAYSTVNTVERIVEDRIDDASATSDALLATALATLTALQNVEFTFDATPVPAAPLLDPDIDISLTLPVITPTSFGSVTSNMPTAPALDDIPAIGDLTIPDFVSSIGSLTIPVAPDWTAPEAAPIRPDTDTVTLPTAPVLSMPGLPLLTDIVIPDFAGVVLPLFDATMPEFAETALPGVLQWAEPTYQPEILTEVLAKIRDLWSGNSGIPAAVEQAMIERALSREDMIANREIDAVAEEYSLRGFTMPTGMQAARVDQMRQDLAVKKQSMNRELTIKFAETHIENIRFGVQQAIAAENVYVNVFLNMASRMFEAAKFRVQSQVEIYNAQVSLYNAQINGFQIRAQVFDILVKAELSDIEVYKAEVDAEIARGQLNEQKVRTYTAQIQALQTQIEIYKAEMQGASVHSDVIRNQIEGYKADVQAYAERINADKVRFDAYESQVKGESAKAGIIDAEARAYSALIQGKASMADIDVKRADVTIQRNRNLIEGYAAELDAEKARILSQTSVIQAGAQAYVADTQRFAAIAQAQTAQAQVTVSAKESEMRTNIAYYEAKVQAYLGNMEQMIRQSALVVDSLKSAGQLSATLAAGAMAGVHVGATLSGAGGVQAGGSYSESISTSESNSYSENHNYEGV